MRGWHRPGLAAALVMAGLTAATASVAQPAPRPDDAPGAFKRPRHDRPLADGQLARGKRNIAAAWFSSPTGRYRHFVLGSEHEPERLWVSTDKGKTFAITLGPDAVFEDRAPRIADLDGDGIDEVVVVKSYITKGAALAVAAVRPDGLHIVAETPPVGTPFRWLNPAGVGDFDGDGRPDIALVRMPHAAGELEIWTVNGLRLERWYQSGEREASNHVAGSGYLFLSAVADFDGDGTADLAVPTFDRRQLRFLSFKGRRAREIATVDLPARAAEDFRVVERDGRMAVEVGMAGGRKFIAVPR